MPTRFVAADRPSSRPPVKSANGPWGLSAKKDVCQIQHIAQAAGQRRHREKRKDDAERRARQRNEKAFARSKCKGRRTTGIMRIKSGSAGAERGMV